MEAILLHNIPPTDFHNFLTHIGGYLFFLEEAVTECNNLGIFELNFDVGLMGVIG